MGYVDAVTALGNWYADNVWEYNKFGWIDCPLGNVGKTRKDCSGFVSGCMRLANIFPPGVSSASGGFVNGTGATYLMKAGFVRLPWNGFDSCLAFDVLAMNGHVEIYAGNYKSWGWGDDHSRKHGRDMPWPSGKKHVYQCVWRLNGIPTDYTGDGSYGDGSYGSGDSGGGGGSGFGIGAYDTILDLGKNVTYEQREGVFTPPENNTLSLTTELDFSSLDSNGKHTRIYGAGKRTIKVDELSMPLDAENAMEQTGDRLNDYYSKYRKSDWG